MIGNKLRSWMEAVRPKKKQQRKEKNAKSNISYTTAVYETNLDSVCGKYSGNDSLQEIAVRKSMIGNESRYSGTNLSSPESAYSTGYSTDGTSPGNPLDYYVNIRTGNKNARETDKNISRQLKQSSGNYRIIHNNSEENNLKTLRGKLPSSFYPSASKNLVAKDQTTQKPAVEKHPITLQQKNIGLPQGILSKTSSPHLQRLAEPITSVSVTSPRQRNRIRTNPWLPGNSLSPGTSSINLNPFLQDPFSSPLLSNTSSSRLMSSHIQKNPEKTGTSAPRESLSSSSCSSLSDEDVPWKSNLIQNTSRLKIESENEEDDEEDCTLNEMMGKYDESYVYEKETDILSDSDPTDCETDLDTGQDGGDEGEATEREFDFIDNGSLKEFGFSEKEIRNTGHCVYFSYEGHSRQISRRKTIRKSQKTDPKNFDYEKRKKSSSFKKHSAVKPSEPIQRLELKRTVRNGSRSAGATPLSKRKTKRSAIKHLYEEQHKKRSNSLSCSETINMIDERDKEAEKKYKELIVEAEHILMTMKTNGFSPRRLPTPTNKRVEMLRNGESPVKSDAYLRNRLIEDTANSQLSKIPSTALCSPKKYQVINFMNNSHQYKKREIENRQPHLDSGNYLQNTLVKKKHLSPKMSRKSPKFRKKTSKNLGLRNDSSSSDEENDKRSKKNHVIARNNFLCPQSEPVKRKNYFVDNQVFANYNYQKGLLNSDSNRPYICNRSGLEINNSAENLRQQALLNTIASLKRSLEDQSASLQVYRSSQNVND